MKAPNVVGFRWKGFFDQKAFQESVEAFLPELNKRDSFNMYFEIVDIEGVEGKALWQDVKFSLQQMSGFQEKIGKIALVSDKGWIRSLSQMSSMFVPHITLKSFSFSEADAALKYAESL